MPDEMIPGDQSPGLIFRLIRRVVQDILRGRVAISDLSPRAVH